MEREKVAGPACNECYVAGGAEKVGVKEEVEEEEDEEEELLGVRLRKRLAGLCRKGGPFTPVPAWKLEPRPSTSDAAAAAGEPAGGASVADRVSARKLGANLWEIQDMLHLKGASRRARRRKDGELLGAPELPPLAPLLDPPQSAGSPRRRASTSSVQHHKLIERGSRAMQPVSPTSYSSSMEVTPFNRPITSSSSLDIKGRLQDSGYSLKTSTELLKVLNRIWSLEEQHASNLSLIKTLKLELQHAWARIDDLMQEQQAYRHEMDHLMKKVAEEKLIRKDKEQDRIQSAIQAIRDELEDERRLRKRSENLHRKLGKELSEVKSAFSKAVKDLECHRKTNVLLEDLCDEFAGGIKEYEQELRELKQKSEKDHGHKFDRLVLHMSEAWLDVRLQIKIAEESGDIDEKDSITDRLSGEIKTFLQAMQSNSSKNEIGHQQEGRKEASLRRHSLESVYLNGTVSAPQDAGDDDSMSSDLNCFELDMDANVNGHHENIKQHGQTLENHESSRKSCLARMDKGKGQKSNGFQVSQSESVFSQKLEDCHIREGIYDMQANSDGLCNDLINSLMKNPSESSEGCKIHPCNDHGEESHNHLSGRGHVAPPGLDNSSAGSHRLPIPVQQLNHRQKLLDLEISECSEANLPQGVKENTLKAKLLEARLEGKHARLKAIKGSSIDAKRQ